MLFILSLSLSRARGNPFTSGKMSSYFAAAAAAVWGGASTEADKTSVHINPKHATKEEVDSRIDALAAALASTDTAALLRKGGEPGLLPSPAGTIDRATLSRWLKAEKLDVASAASRLEKHAHWRADYVSGCLRKWRGRRKGGEREKERMLGGNSGVENVGLAPSNFFSPSILTSCCHHVARFPIQVPTGLIEPVSGREGTANAWFQRAGKAGGRHCGFLKKNSNSTSSFLLFRLFLRFSSFPPRPPRDPPSFLFLIFVLSST